MGGLFSKPKISDNQKKLEEQQLMQQKKLDRQEEARMQAMRRSRAGRGSLISGATDAGLRSTLGGS